MRPRRFQRSERVTIRVPSWMKKAIQDRLRGGEYLTESELVREALRGFFKERVG